MSNESGETNSLPPFRLSPQVAIMILIVMAALALPLAGIAWFVRGYIESRKAPGADGRPGVEAVAQPLRDSLEIVASESLGTAAAAFDDHVIKLSVPPANLAARIERIQEITRAAGGSVLEIPAVPDAAGEGASEPGRLLVTLPESRATLFRRALDGTPADFESVESVGDTVLIEIRLVSEQP